MALPELQTALVRAVSGKQASTTGKNHNGELSKREATWLAELPGRRGLEVIGDVQRWWRKARLRTSLPLSSRLLDRIESDDHSLLDHYFSEQASASLHYQEEGYQFQQFIKDHPTHLHESDHARLLALVEFEMGVREASEQYAVLRSPGSSSRCNHPSLPEPRFDIHQAIFRAYIHFPCDPSELIAALAGNTALPPDLESPVTVVVDSDIPHYWQIVDVDLNYELD